MSRAPCRRRLVLAASMAAAWPARARAGDVTLPVAGDLPAQLLAALRQRQPLVVLVSLPGCPFCKAVRESHLAPAVREQGLPVVQVDMRSQQALCDFRGEASTHERLIEAWRIRIAPTVLFLGARGDEVAQRLVGSYLPDFYGGYLEQRLEAARRQLA